MWTWPRQSYVDWKMKGKEAFCTHAFISKEFCFVWYFTANQAAGQKNRVFTNMHYFLVWLAGHGGYRKWVPFYTVLTKSGWKYNLLTSSDIDSSVWTWILDVSDSDETLMKLKWQYTNDALDFSINSPILQNLLSKSYCGPPGVTRTSPNARSNSMEWHQYPRTQALLIRQVFTQRRHEHHEIRSWLAIGAALDERPACSHQVDAFARSLHGPAPAPRPAGNACPSASLASQAILLALQKQAYKRRKKNSSHEHIQ